jgi:hypothetical protein
VRRRQLLIISTACYRGRGRQLVGQKRRGDACGRLRGPDDRRLRPPLGDGGGRTRRAWTTCGASAMERGGRGTMHPNRASRP